MSIWDNAPRNSQAVFQHLKILAKRMRTESYGEIAKAIGMAESREIAPIAMRYPLGFIRDNICRPRGLPWLNALAVKGETWLPGESFLPEEIAPTEPYGLWKSMVFAVFAYPWDCVTLE